MIDTKRYEHGNIMKYPDDVWDETENVARVAADISIATSKHPVTVLKELMHDEDLLTDIMFGKKSADDIVDCANKPSAEEADRHLQGYIGEELRNILYWASINDISYHQMLAKCDEYEIWLLIAAYGRKMALYSYPVNAGNIDAWIEGRPLHLF